MSSKRPCAVCRTWFLPDPRVRRRQRCCEREECRSELHRRACADWRRRNVALIREDRVANRIAAKAPPLAPTAAVAADPTAAVHWPAVDAAVGVEVSLVFRQALQLVSRALRDEFRAQLPEKTAKTARVRREGMRDEMPAQPLETPADSGGVPPAVPRDETAPPARPP